MSDTDIEKLKLQLEICEKLYATEHCQLTECKKNKKCIECIERRYKRMINAAKDDSENIGITD